MSSSRSKDSVGQNDRLVIVTGKLFNGIDKTSELVNDYSIKWLSDNK